MPKVQKSKTGLKGDEATKEGQASDLRTIGGEVADRNCGCDTKAVKCRIEFRVGAS